MNVPPHSLQLPRFQEGRKHGMRSCHANNNRAIFVSQGKVDPERRNALRRGRVK
ncbi:hypothetical protein AB0912_10075 [Streptomyces sp. NPDC007084]|uniref:hypothetical protein n=1 Tax=Streptomyces sp. NPDC007084 TaxID=3154313 RepID=UPI0034539FDD